uniref:Uncharacterized protein n=1 Tax=Meloidogyne hapla TaxID=6305 RepID=A0A1I8BT32_MELHA
MLQIFVNSFSNFEACFNFCKHDSVILKHASNICKHASAIDLWTYSWDRNLFPDCLSRFYQQLKDEEKQKTKKSSNKLKSKEYQQPNEPPQILSDTVEYLSINKSTHCKSSSPFNKKNGAIKKLPQRPSSAAIILENENNKSGMLFD